MKIPEEPPILDLEPSEILKVLRLTSSDRVRPLLIKANKNYMYWSKFKHQKMPDSVEPGAAWFCLKYSRRTQARNLPVKDKKNKPFSFWLPESVQESLHFIDSFAGGNISSKKPIITSELNTQYLINSLMEEAISSSLLEGAARTREQGKEMLLSGKKPVNHFDKMIFNNYSTICKLKSLKGKPLSMDLLNEIHRSITKDTLKDLETSGRFRRQEDGDIVVSDLQGNTLFVPPLPEDIEARIEELIKFANEDKEFIHPVVKAIILHFWLAYIHPYVDGNGRTARALFYWYMLKKDYWMLEYVSISHFILKSAKKYAEAYLYSEMDEQDLTYFISYNLRIIRLGIEEVNRYLVKKQKEIGLMSNYFKEYPNLNLRQLDFLNHLVKHPENLYSIQNHKAFHGITYQTARTDLLGLEKENFLKKIQKGKKFYFLLNKEVVEELLINKD